MVTAKNGVDGLTQAMGTRPNLVLMDVQMPVVDGVETTQRLRSQPGFERTPIFALTGFAVPDDRERGIAAGMSAYMSRPINPGTLTKLIQGTLD